MSEHNDRLPQCEERFNRIDENQDHSRRSVDKKLTEISESLTALKKGLLDGNGKKGLIYQQDDRIKALEESHREAAPKTVKDTILSIPWYGWSVILLCLNTLNPQTWSFLRAVAKRVAGI